MVFKNIDITPGIEADLSFEIRDEDGLLLNLSSSTFRLEVYDTFNTLILLITSPVSSINGNVKFLLSKLETRTLTLPSYNYRLVITNSQSISKIHYQGFISCSEPVFDSLSGPVSTEVLPNGVLYPTAAITITPDVWYAITSFYRFMITGIGVLVIDGMDLRGTVFLNRGVFLPTDGQPTQWIPELENMTAFRINLVSGNPQIRYLP